MMFYTMMKQLFRKTSSNKWGAVV